MAGSYDRLSTASTGQGQALPGLRFPPFQEPLSKLELHCFTVKNVVFPLGGNFCQKTSKEEKSEFPMRICLPFIEIDYSGLSPSSLL